VSDNILYEVLSVTMKSKRRALEQRVIEQAVQFVSRNPVACDLLTEAVLDLEDLSYEGKPAVGRNSPDTSRAAADMIAPKASSIRREILEEIILVYMLDRDLGLTCDQVERRLRRPHTTVSSAINWLRDNGWLIDSEWRRETPSGRAAIVWNPTRRALEQSRLGWRN